MEFIKQIAILSKLGYGKKAIARELNLLKNTVKRYLAKSEETNGSAQNDRRETLHDFFPYVKEEYRSTVPKTKVVPSKDRNKTAAYQMYINPIIKVQ